MLQKLIEQAQKLNEAKKNRDSRYENLKNEYLQFKGLVRDVFTEHHLPEQTISVDNIEFTLNTQGCSFSSDSGTLTKPILNKLMQITFEYLLQVEKDYDQQLAD